MASLRLSRDGIDHIHRGSVSRFLKINSREQNRVLKSFNTDLSTKPCFCSKILLKCRIGEEIRSRTPKTAPFQKVELMSCLMRCCPFDFGTSTLLLWCFQHKSVCVERFLTGESPTFVSDDQNFPKRMAFITISRWLSSFRPIGAVVFPPGLTDIFRASRLPALYAKKVAFRCEIAQE